MPQLLVRDIESTVVKRLRVRAAAHGVSVEEAHRRLLRSALLGDKPEPQRCLVGLETHCGDWILPITAHVADTWGRPPPAQPLPVSDGLIAATALEHKLTIVPRTAADFTRSGVNTLNPFS